MAQPSTLFLAALCLLVASRAAAQPQPSVRQPQDRRALLPTTPAEPIPELYLAASNLTTVLLNRPLDRDSLVVDRTRFKWVDVGDRTLSLQLLTDLEPGERLIIKIGFKDRGLPTQAVFAAVTDSTVVDDNVEVERQANSPETLVATLARKDAELEELKARCESSSLTSVALSGWFKASTRVITLKSRVSPGDTSGLVVTGSRAYPGTFSTVVVIGVRNLPGQAPLAVGQARVTNAAGTPIEVLSVQLKPRNLAPGKKGLVALEVKTPDWEAGQVVGVELVDSSGQRRLFLNLSKP